MQHSPARPASVTAGLRTNPVTSSPSTSTRFSPSPLQVESGLRRPALPEPCCRSVAHLPAAPSGRRRDNIAPFPGSSRPKMPGQNVARSCSCPRLPAVNCHNDLSFGFRQNLRAAFKVHPRFFDSRLGRAVKAIALAVACPWLRLSAPACGYLSACPSASGRCVPVLWPA